MTKTGSSAMGEIVVERTFDAPRELVWKAWTDPELFKQWYGPQGFTVPSCSMDLRVGGRRTCLMSGPGGMEMWTAGEYMEIVPNERIAYTEYHSDDQGNPVPMPGMPGTTTVTITFEDVSGKTKMTLRHAGHPAEQAASEGANRGWMQAFDKLEAALPSMR